MIEIGPKLMQAIGLASLAAILIAFCWCLARMSR